LFGPPTPVEPQGNPAIRFFPTQKTTSGGPNATHPPEQVHREGLGRDRPPPNSWPKQRRHQQPKTEASLAGPLAEPAWPRAFSRSRGWIPPVLAQKGGKRSSQTQPKRCGAESCFLGKGAHDTCSIRLRCSRRSSQTSFLSIEHPACLARQAMEALRGARLALAVRQSMGETREAIDAVRGSHT